MNTTNLAYDDWEEQSWEELIDGKPVAMSPRPSPLHNSVANNIYRILSTFLLGKPCRPFDDGTTVFLTEKDHFVPDGMIICDKNKVRGNGVHGAPDLVVEVLSPSSKRRDRHYKKAVYESCGVREYWIVDPAAMSVEQYLLEDGRLSLHDVHVYYSRKRLEELPEEEQEAVSNEFPCGIFPDLSVRLAEVFAWVSDD